MQDKKRHQSSIETTEPKGLEGKWIFRYRGSAQYNLRRVKTNKANQANHIIEISANQNLYYTILRNQFVIENVWKFDEASK